MVQTLTIPPLWMGLPFISVLVLMTLAPYAFPRLWHRYESIMLTSLGVLTIVGLLLTIGKQSTVHELIHLSIQDYLPFVILLSSLYIVTSGFQMNLNIRPTPLNNTLFLGGGAILSSVIGTTGASMVLLRPFMDINQKRTSQTHSIIFFIFLISNIGGCLTPIGDPPLFLGYLNGVDFFWTLRSLIKPFMVTSGILLVVYYTLDFYIYKKETNTILNTLENRTIFTLKGKINLLLVIILILFVVAPGLLQRHYSQLPTIIIDGHTFSWVQILCNIGLLLTALCSYLLTPRKIRHHQHFSWKPILEVARVFAIIFVTIIPLSLMLKAGAHGPLNSVFNITQQSSSPAFIYFWLTGIFSAFLDNAPTYLLFFQMAGGDADTLMTSNSLILMAISLASVFMGAMTYIGNAPNFMVRTLAKQRGIAMPGFLGYMLWSTALLLPLFLGVSLWLFH
jgi:Na+/H+ antiporter NhaD/arsenite permease-like protein